MTNFPGIEPTAKARELARAVRDIYVGLRKEGFTDAQALVIVGHIFAASALAPPNPDDKEDKA